jgi:hypothetical protein
MMHRHTGSRGEVTIALLEDFATEEKTRSRD